MFFIFDKSIYNKSVSAKSMQIEVNRNSEWKWRRLVDKVFPWPVFGETREESERKEYRRRRRMERKEYTAILRTRETRTGAWFRDIELEIRRESHLLISSGREELLESIIKWIRIRRSLRTCK